MECICGKNAWSMDAGQFRARISGFREVLLELGTGDGRFVLKQVNSQPDLFGIGLDACRENLCEASRRETPRSLFLIANALELPSELAGTVSLLTINFPWGSLLDGLLVGEGEVMEGIACVEVSLNASAVQKADIPLAAAGERVRQGLERAGFHIRTVERLEGERLKFLPTTWARKIAFGRAPQAVLLRGAIR